MSGKGSAPRNCFSQAFRDNYDQIFRKCPVKYVVRFDNGSYNFHLGHQATLAEATRYETLESAQKMADKLTGVERIEEVRE